MAIIYSDEFRAIVEGDPLVYIDAGARGGLQGPWAEIDDERLYVVAFEPDPSASAELAGSHNSRRQVVSKALWSRAGSVEVHLAEVPGTSSIHPPNWKLLERYPEPHAAPRTTVRRLTVDCVPLDSALDALDRRADFIKIDTQGAEYEILVGASRALADSVFGVIAETWTVEVHQGQRLTGDILNFMHDRGFELFDLSVAAAWHRRGADRLARKEKRQIIGLDLLFFREPSRFPDRFASVVAATKAAAIAELYGYPDMALEIIDLCVPTTALEAGLVDRLRRAIISGPPAAVAGTGRESLVQRLFGRKGSGRKDVKLHY
jgi:FkbM family methyltransferase